MEPAGEPSPSGGDGRNPIALEQELPGTPDWPVARGARYGELEGYASAPSVQHGETFDLHVRSDRPAALR